MEQFQLFCKLTYVNYFVKSPIVKPTVKIQLGSISPSSPLSRQAVLAAMTLLLSVAIRATSRLVAQVTDVSLL